MIFLIFLWWNYTDKEFEKIETTTLFKPIFSVCTSPTCPHCKGIPESLKSYSDSLGNKTKIIFTNINCGYTKFCKRFGIQGVPSFFLIRGNNKKYWTTTYESKPNGWNQFLNNEIGPNIFEIQSLNNVSFSNFQNGGSFFHLELNRSQLLLYKRYSHLSSIYKIYGTKFSYTFNTNSNSILTIYYSNQKFNKYLNIDLNNINNLIEKNLFSYYHHYDVLEFITIIKEKPLILIVTTTSTSNSQINIINNLIFENLNITIGWASMDTDKYTLEVSKNFKNIKPFLFGINQKKNCLIKYYYLENNINYSLFINNLLNGNNCEKIGKIKTGLPPIPKFKIIIFFIIFIIIFSILYLLIIIYTNNNLNKKE